MAGEKVEKAVEVAQPVDVVQQVKDLADPSNFHEALAAPLIMEDD